MAILSNDIEEFIKAMLQNGIAELQRNELAGQFHCAPSQINYVLSTRFSLDKGYVVRSRRGGGGYIRIMRINVDQSDYIFDIINGCLGEGISCRRAQSILDGMVATGILSEDQKKIIAAAVSDTALAICHEQETLRANILKQVLAAMLYEE